MNRPRTITELVSALPPFVVFALGQRGSPRPTVVDLARRSGFSQRSFQRLARRQDWAGVKLADLEAFCAACRVDMLHQGQAREYLRNLLRGRSKFAHLTGPQRRNFDVACKVWRLRKLQGIERED